jgi:hypothetical protein
MTRSRRWFLKSSAAFGAGVVGVRAAVAAPKLRRVDGDIGRLVPDPSGIVDLPRDFTYTVLSRAGEEMDDGLLVPALHDGMAAFPGADGRTVLVRNHEALNGGGAFGAGNERFEKIDRAKVFDSGYGRTPATGGTTTLVFDTTAQRLERHYLSLAGTTRNCAGGPTPWGSWITCEEYEEGANEVHEREHGWCFEVPSSAEGLVDPVPLTALGRFNHEAVAVDAASGCLYLTEDQPDGLLYRFVPDTPGDLHAGGLLQALAVRGAPSLDTRNWHAFTQVPEGTPMEVSWIDLDRVENPDGDLRRRGFLAGAARFARGEGIWAGDGEIFFAATAGGASNAGQVWRYEPGRDEGTDRERLHRGTLTLFAESPHRRMIDMCDNVTIAPWGDVILCEDGPGENHLVGVTRRGDIYPLARNAMVDERGSASEFAGACFSPDGSTLFCNLQGPGVTLAITGPWPT